METHSYKFRPSLFTKTRIIEANDTTVTIRKPDRLNPERTIRYQDIKYLRKIHCCMGGDEMGENRFPITMLKIVPFRGKKIVIKSASYVGTGSKRAYHADNHQEEFEAFSAKFERRLMLRNPLVPLVEGSLGLSITSLMLTIFCGLIAFASPLMMVYSDRSVLESLPFLATLIVFSALIGYLCYSMFIGFWPKKHRLDELTFHE